MQPVEPLVSVLMPIRNEATFITRSLGAVLDQDYPHERMEILIADGMSDDGTLDIIRKMQDAMHITIIPNSRRIQSAGLNLAIRRASGEYVIRVDGHTIIAPDYVRQCVIALKETGAMNVGGAMDPTGLTNVGEAIAIAGKSRFAVPSVFHVSKIPQFTDTVYMGAFPRSVFEMVGLYDENFSVNEDYELNHRIRNLGGKIFFSPLIRSTYYGRQGFSPLARQYFRYGQSKIKTLRKHPESLKVRQIIAPLFVAALFGGALLSRYSSIGTTLWLFMILVYGSVALFVSLKIAKQHGWRLLPRLPLIFFIIHTAWGIGFWSGIVQILFTHGQSNK